MQRLVLAAVLALTLVGADTASAAPRLAVGDATLTRCEDDAAFFCGTLSRPLDRLKPNGRRIRIAFRWRPADRRGKRSGPPIVAVEGGPGYPSVGSAVEYTGIAGPLLRTRDLLLVDNRGTGGSALIGCKRLQGFDGRTDTESFASVVAGCARAIDRRFGRGASSRFGTADAVDDLAAVMRRLKLPPVALYGDSYGTYFAQSFMARHPGRLNSVVLDSSYPVRDLDPFYASSGATARGAFDAVCERDLGCRDAARAYDAATAPPADPAEPAAAPSTATDRLDTLVSRLRAAPLRGRTRDADGSGVTQTVTPRTLVDLVQWAASDAVIYRELDAATRAALQDDPMPLLRLAAQASTWNAGGSPATYFSNGAYFAVGCVDYPQLFDMQASRAARRTQLATSITGGPADAFSPFTLPEWLSMSAYSEPYRACLDWPRPQRVRPAVPPEAKPLPADVPVLVIGGDLDSLTPLRDAHGFAPKLGAAVRVVDLKNTVHVTSEGDTTLVVGASCGRRIIRAFWSSPGWEAAIDTSCADAIPPVHTAGAYPATLDAASADEQLRIPTVAAGAVGDAIARRTYLAEPGTVPGLRGGTVRARGDRVVRFTFRDVRFVEDATVTGTAVWRIGAGDVRATLRVRDELGGTTPVTLSWDQRSPTASARVDGAALLVPAP